MVLLGYLFWLPYGCFPIVWADDPFCVNGAGTVENLYEVAGYAIIGSVCGYQQHGVGSTGGNIVDHHTGLEVGWQGEVGSIVQLIPSYIMIPQKSLTMVMGVEAELKSSGRTCDFCTMRETCRYQEHYLAKN